MDKSPLETAFFRWEGRLFQESLYHAAAVLQLNFHHHVAFWGRLGVQLFFMISGFLIVSSFARNRDKYGLREGGIRYAVARA
ncbi:MAG: hypothetical protein GY862_02680 [Gammaproteobacteria bacterium]|nr:hypothetical protein [Gammaproteobacteria bacterium]